MFESELFEDLNELRILATHFFLSPVRPNQTVLWTKESSRKVFALYCRDDYELVLQYYENRYLILRNAFGPDSFLLVKFEAQCHTNRGMIV